MKKLGLLILLISIAILLFSQNSQNVREIEYPYLIDLEGYVQVYPDAAVINNVGVVFLSSECYRLIARTETSQARSIELGIKKQIVFRPTTHDIMKEVLDKFGIRVLGVKIDDVRNNTFIGQIILRRGNQVLQLDSRPSDGIALAVRTNSPIYIKQSLLEEFGEKIC